MDTYEKHSREELIRMIGELKAENERLRSDFDPCAVPGNPACDQFKNRYALRILDSLPDMLTVIDRSGTLIELVTSEETNHVGASGAELVGLNIGAILSGEAYRHVKQNLDRVFATGECGMANHDITLDGITRHYENRIFPLDDRYVLCMCRDVTDAVRASRKLERANRRMGQAEEIASLWHWYYFEESDEISAPRIVSELAGFEGPGTTRCDRSFFLSHVHPADRERLQEQFRNPQSEGYVEVRIVLSGETRYFHSRVIHTFEKGGKQAVEGYMQDMTYLVGQLHELEALKYAINRAQEEIFACDTEGNLVFFNRTLAAGKPFFGLMPGADTKIYDLDPSGAGSDVFRELMDKVRECGGSYSFQTRNPNDAGKMVERDITAYSIFDDFREKEMLWFISRDVTYREKQESKIRELNSVMDAILNNIPVDLFVKDPGNEFRYLYWNKAFETDSGIPASQAIGRTDFEIFPNRKDAEKFRQDDLYLLRTGERIEFIEEYVSVSGQTRIVSTSKALVPSENSLPWIIGVSMDISDLKNSEKELIAAKIKAEESDRLKSAFLANMSHEIRTPLNAIVGFSQLILSAEDEAERKEYFSVINRNSDLLLHLINDILDISKIEAGTLAFEHRPMSLNKLCRETCDVLNNRVCEGVSLIFDEREDAVFLCDPNRVAQVVTNLLTNAVKFTRQGEIRCGFFLKGDRIEFYVSDTGPGIPERDRATIFERFVKLDQFAVGTGLGLSITKMIVEKLGGKIWVESVENQGSVFRFTLPYKPERLVVCQPSDRIGPVRSAVSGRQKILIAEDIDSNYMLVKAFVGKRFALVRAANGKEAVDLFRREQPDLVLMDIKMPVMDGYESTRQIRRLSSDVPIVAMSAFAFEQDKEQALEVGCSDYLTKPVLREQFEEKLERYLHAAAE